MSYRDAAAQLAPTALVHDSACVYGPSIVGDDAMVEAYGVIGQPRQAAVDQLRSAISPVTSVDELYARASEGALLRHNVVIRSGCVIYGSAEIAAFAEVAHHSVVREGAMIGPYSRLLPGVSVRTGATVGRGCRIAGVVGDRAIIGDYVTMFGVLAHSYSVAVGGHAEPAPVLERGVCVGRGACVVGKVTVGEFAFVAANALVARDVPPYGVVAGNPARIIGERDRAQVDAILARIAEGRYL